MSGTLSIDLEGISFEVLPKYDRGDSSVGIPAHWEFEVQSWTVTDEYLAVEGGFLSSGEPTSKAYAKLEDRAQDAMRGTYEEDWAYDG